ncbi:hypothetical protein GGH95_000923 [Coemansia sp. RSA 1836]|nr:hypothetical protein GGH95_000923 [Coemansia sp. RSA 1836]
MKIYVGLFALGVASATTIFAHRAPKTLDDALLERSGGRQQAESDVQQLVPKLVADYPPSLNVAPRRGRTRPATGNPAAKPQVAAVDATNTTSAGRNLNKEIREALVNPEEGQAADNNFSALLVSAIATSHGDLAILSI